MELQDEFEHSVDGDGVVILRHNDMLNICCGILVLETTQLGIDDGMTFCAVECEPLERGA
jgi:hypothetical protein